KAASAPSIQVRSVPLSRLSPSRRHPYSTSLLGTDIHTGEEVAIKMMALQEHLRGRRGNLEAEARAFASVAGTTRGGKRGIPRVLWHGQECEYYVLVTDLLGPSLDDLQNYCGGRFSMKTVLMIADQAIARLQTIHNSG